TCSRACESRELLGDEARRVQLTARAPLAHREDRLPTMELLEAERRAHELLSVTCFGVHVTEPRERRSRDRAVPEVVGGALVVEVLGRVVLVTGAAEQVRAGGVDQVLLRVRARGVHHVVALALALERRAAVDDDASTLQREDARQLRVEPEVVTD